MDSKDCLSHQKLAAITSPDGQTQHATDLAGRTIDGLAQAPSAQVITSLSTPTDIPPEPEEILPPVGTGIREFCQERITAKSSRPEILADKKAFLE
jgi:hypothetical protein